MKISIRSRPGPGHRQGGEASNVVNALMSRIGKKPTLWILAYRATLRLYPRRHREVFGSEMVQMFDDLMRSERTRGWGWGIVFGIRTLVDSPRSAWVVRGRVTTTVPYRNRKGEPMWNLMQDIRYAVRGLLRTPGFTTTAVLTLALGIGANTAIFSVVNGVLFKPLPYQNPEQLGLVWNRFTNTDVLRARLSGPDLIDYQRDTQLLQGLAGAWAIGTNLSGVGEAEQITLSWVSTNFFDLLGIDAVVGRTFAPADKNNTDIGLLTDLNFTPPANALVLSYGLWQRRFGSDPTVIGRNIRVNSQPMVVIGVAPRSFRLLLPVDAEMSGNVDAWTLFPTDISQGNRAANNLTVVARMKPGVTFEQAQGELRSITQRLREQHEVHERLGTEIDLVPMHAEVVGHVQPVLYVLMGAVGFVLLIACANVANLLLVRASTRTQEFAIRGALGGSRRRIVQQVFTESLVLAAAGSAAGLIFAGWGIKLLLLLRPENLPRAETIALDSSVLMFALAATLLSAIVFGLAPAFQSTSVDLASMRSRGSATRGAGKHRLRSALAVSEIAMSLMLLIGAGLLFKSFVLLNRVQPGFDANNVISAHVSLPFFSYRDAGKRADFFERLAERVAELPGVESVGGITPLPLTTGDGQDWTGPYAVSEADSEDWASKEADYRPVLPGFFTTMGTNVLSGRGFTRADNVPNARNVIIVDEALSERVWPDRDPVGEQLLIRILNESATGSVATWAEVVGVSQNIRHTDLRRDGSGTIYLPYRTFSWFELSLVIRTSAEPAAMTSAIRAIAGEMDGTIPIFDVRALGEYVEEAAAPTRFAMVLIGVFAGVAAVLATIGLFGVVSYAVRQRVAEFGIRIAFGASRQNIVRLVLRDGVRLCITGLALGSLVALMLTRTLAGLLFGVSPTDPVSFVVVLVLLASVTLLACYLPARRATQVDPVKALKIQ